MSSITEIARIAGVGVSTVSRYFNCPEKVSGAVAGRIREAAARLGYHPRLRRPGPKSGGRPGIHTGKAALLFCGGSPAEQRLLTGSIREALARRDMALLLPPGGESLPDWLNRRQCDGVIVAGVPPSAAFAARLKRWLRDLPAVWCLAPGDGDRKIDRICCDHRGAGVLAAGYLGERSCRTVVLVNVAGADDDVCNCRAAGFRERAAELGLTVHEFAPPSRAAAENCRLAAEWLAGEARLPEAGIFFCSDEALMGVWLSLRSPFVPEGIALICCGGGERLPECLRRRPAMIDPGIIRAGEIAVRQLLTRINGDRSAGYVETLVPPELY